MNKNALIIFNDVTGEELYAVVLENQEDTNEFLDLYPEIYEEAPRNNAEEKGYYWLDAFHDEKNALEFIKNFGLVYVDTIDTIDDEEDEDDEDEEPTSLTIKFLRTKNGEDIVSFAAIETETSIRLVHPVEFIMFSYEDEDEQGLEMRGWLPIEQMTFPSVVIERDNFLFIVEGSECLTTEFMKDYCKFIGWDKIGKEKDEVKSEGNVVQFNSRPKK